MGLKVVELRGGAVKEEDQNGKESAGLRIITNVTNGSREKGRGPLDRRIQITGSG